MIMAGRKSNFGAGPSQLPLEVLERASREMLNYDQSGMSVMEMSHRSPQYEALHNRAIATLRDLLCIPDEYYVLFTQCGARMQFDAVPLNLAHSYPTGNYLVTGFWSHMAHSYAQKYTTANVVATSEPSRFDAVPTKDTWHTVRPGYFYYCSNETINGVEYVPDLDTLRRLGGLPVVGDLSSNILTNRVLVSEHAALLAGAQKNLGPAGVTVCIARKDVCGSALPITPSLLDWKLQGDANSMYNTPPTYMIYMVGLYLDYVKQRGGVDTFYEESVRKSRLVYDVVDESAGFYTSRVAQANRSRVNIPLSILRGNPALEKLFLSEAEALNMTQLAGHKSAGGLRISLYNGVSEAEAVKVSEFMTDFLLRHCPT